MKIEQFFSFEKLVNSKGIFLNIHEDFDDEVVFLLRSFSSGLQRTDDLARLTLERVWVESRVFSAVVSHGMWPEGRGEVVLSLNPSSPVGTLLLLTSPPLPLPSPTLSRPSGDELPVTEALDGAARGVQFLSRILPATLTSRLLRDGARSKLVPPLEGSLASIYSNIMGELGSIPFTKGAAPSPLGPMRSLAFYAAPLGIRSDEAQGRAELWGSTYVFSRIAATHPDWSVVRCRSPVIAARDLKEVCDSTLARTRVLVLDEFDVGLLKDSFFLRLVPRNPGMAVVVVLPAGISTPFLAKLDYIGVLAEQLPSELYSSVPAVAEQWDRMRNACDYSANVAASPMTLKLMANFARAVSGDDLRAVVEKGIEMALSLTKPPQLTEMCRCVIRVICRDFVSRRFVSPELDDDDARLVRFLVWLVRVGGSIPMWLASLLLGVEEEETPLSEKQKWNRQNAMNEVVSKDLLLSSALLRCDQLRFGGFNDIYIPKPISEALEEVLLEKFPDLLSSGASPLSKGDDGLKSGFRWLKEILEIPDLLIFQKQFEKIPGSPKDGKSHYEVFWNLAGHGTKDKINVWDAAIYIYLAMSQQITTKKHFQGEELAEFAIVMNALLKVSRNIGYPLGRDFLLLPRRLQSMAFDQLRELLDKGSNSWDAQTCCVAVLHFTALNLFHNALREMSSVFSSNEPSLLSEAELFDLSCQLEDFVWMSTSTIVFFKDQNESVLLSSYVASAASYVQLMEGKVSQSVEMMDRGWDRMNEGSPNTDMYSHFGEERWSREVFTQSVRILLLHRRARSILVRAQLHSFEQWGGRVHADREEFAGLVWTRVAELGDAVLTCLNRVRAQKLECPHCQLLLIRFRSVFGSPKHLRRATYAQLVEAIMKPRGAQFLARSPSFHARAPGCKVCTRKVAVDLDLIVRYNLEYFDHEASRGEFESTLRLSQLSSMLKFFNLKGETNGVSDYCETVDYQMQLASLVLSLHRRGVVPFSRAWDHSATALMEGAGALEMILQSKHRGERVPVNLFVERGFLQWLLGSDAFDPVSLQWTLELWSDRLRQNSADLMSRVRRFRNAVGCAGPAGSSRDFPGVFLAVLSPEEEVLPLPHLSTDRTDERGMGRLKPPPGDILQMLSLFLSLSHPAKVDEVGNIVLASQDMTVDACEKMLEQGDMHFLVPSAAGNVVAKVRFDARYVPHWDSLVHRAIRMASNFKDKDSDGNGKIHVIHIHVHGDDEYSYVNFGQKIGNADFISKLRDLQNDMPVNFPRYFLFTRCKSKNLASQLTRDIGVPTCGWKGNINPDVANSFIIGAVLAISEGCRGGKLIKDMALRHLRDHYPNLNLRMAMQQFDCFGFP